jgi:hypothetical protein
MNPDITREPSRMKPLGQPTLDNNAETMKVAKEKLVGVASAAADSAMEYSKEYVGEPAKDVLSMLHDYAKAKPDVAALWCFGIGVMIGWKLRG